ncbi:unnamed protein product [Allacma fusca]|uniref:Uncharacterized protein n=1 Tax=Allacma fusca TaxID=39272 RepID=A0A8J2KHT1_9HEXA|nr:unnamed protein product [Allacma fusca]
MIDQILSVNINTMKKICCALSDFKDCVMKINIHHVCGGGPEEKHPNDGDIAKYALKTLDKSLLAFVAHSCHQEGFHRPGKCKQDDEPRNDLGYLREARNEGFETTPETFPRTSNDLESSATMTFTLKPLLVPLFPDERPQGMSNLSATFREKLHPNLSTSLRNKLNSTEKWKSQVVDEVLAAKVRNASLKYQNPLINHTLTANMAERRIDSGGSSGKDLAPVTANSSSTVSLVVTNSSRNSRIGSGRAFNFINPNQQAEENKIESKITGFYNTSYEITKPTAIIGSNIKANFAVPSWTPSTTVKTSSTVKTTSSTSTAATTTTTTTSRSSTTTTATSSTTTRPADIPEVPNRSMSPRILNNNANGNSLRDLNRALGLSPPSTTPSPKRIDIKSRKNQPEQLNLSNSTKAEESKNSGNFSASEVPIKVFMVWLSTFFV